MSGLVRKATFFVACATVLGVAAAYAGVVSPGNCTVGTGVGTQRINLVGYHTSVGDQNDSVSVNSKLTVTVRDINNNPIAGIPVVLDFSLCTSDVVVGSTQSYHAQTVGCATSTVQGYSTPNGTVSFAVVGGRIGTTALPKHALGCAKVYADSYLLGSINVGAFDENHVSGINGLDIGLVGGDLFSGQNPDRSDFDGNGAVNGLDLGTLGGVLFSGRSNTSSAVICP